MKLTRRQLKKLILEVISLASELPSHGKPTTIGFHGTSLSALESIRKYGLDNRVGRKLGMGMDASTGRGVSMPVVANWTWSMADAIGWAGLAGTPDDPPMLLALDVSHTTQSSRAGQSWAHNDMWYTNTKNPDRSYNDLIIVKPKPSVMHMYGDMDMYPQDEMARYESAYPKEHKYAKDFDIVSNQGVVLGDLVNSVLSQDADLKIAGISTLPRDAAKDRGIEFPDNPGGYGGASDAPIPPEKISYSLDNGATWKKIG